MSDILEEHVKRAITAGIRFDRRKLTEFRKITIERGISKNAEGSARVKIGNTEVLAGIKLSVEKPYPDTPNEGTLMVGAELLPMSSPEFESGPPDNLSIELARVVDRGIRESKAIDNQKLCITPGEKAWTVMIDICTINNDGNLLDAAALAGMAALLDTKFPKYEDGVIDYKTHTDKPLPITKIPVSITVHKIGNSYMVDPSLDEEKAVDNQLTIASTKDGTICALQKAGIEPFMVEDIDRMIDIALEQGKELHKLLGG